MIRAWQFGTGTTQEAVLPLLYKLSLSISQFPQEYRTGHFFRPGPKRLCCVLAGDPQRGPYSRANASARPNLPAARTNAPVAALIGWVPVAAPHCGATRPGIRPNAGSSDAWFRAAKANANGTNHGGL